MKPINPNWKKTLMLLLLLATCFADPLIAANAPITVDSDAVMEVEVINEKGEKEIQRVPASKIIPGDTVIYTNLVTNHSDNPAENIRIDNIIPSDTLFVDGSASAKNASVTFSVDNGKSFDNPAKLKIVEPDGTVRPATPNDFTNIRWTILSPLQPKESQQVEFQVTVK